MKAKVEKEQLKERSRLEEEEPRKSKEKGKSLASALVVSTGETPTAATIEADRPTSSRGPPTATTVKDSRGEEERPTTAKSTEDDGLASPVSPSKRHSRVKSWFSERFHRPGKGGKDGEEGEARKPGFIGGASLTGASPPSDGAEEMTRVESMQDVALAGRPTVHKLVTSPQTEQPVSPIDESQERKGTDAASISSLSDTGEEDISKAKKPQRGRLGFKDKLLGKTNTRTSNDTDNDDFEEARDTFEEEKLAPPPKLTAANVTMKARGSPVRDSRFSENL